MQEMLTPTSHYGPGLGDKVAFITDGRFSGGTIDMDNPLGSRRTHFTGAGNKPLSHSVHTRRKAIVVHYAKRGTAV